MKKNETLQHEDKAYVVVNSNQMEETLKVFGHNEKISNKIVNKCRQLNIEVLTIPGPSSLTSALSISGLPSDSFYFEGFLPKKKGRQTKFNFLSSLPSTVVIFESPFRILKTINDILLFMGNRQICICKELYQKQN